MINLTIQKSFYLFSIIRKIVQLTLSYWILAFLKIQGVKVSYTTRLLGCPIVDIRHGGRLYIGRKVKLISNPRDTALGVNHPCIIRLLSENSVVEIHQGTGISGATICCQDSVIIGEDCLVGANVIIADTDFHPLAPANRRFSKIGVSSGPVIIGNNVFIGTGSIILKNLTIGENSVIGAGSVVVNSLPSNCVAGGNPAKIIRYL